MFNNPQYNTITYQDALDTLGQVNLVLVDELTRFKRDPEAHPIHNFSGLVAIKTYRAYYDHQRIQNKARSSLAKRLRRLLDDPRNEFTIWQSANHHWLCGFLEWRNADSSNLQGITAQQIIASAETLTLDKELANLVATVFHVAQQPIIFDEFVDAIGTLTGEMVRIDACSSDEDPLNTIEQLPAKTHDSVDWLYGRAYLAYQYHEICQLPWDRYVAYMLRLIGDADCDIEKFMLLGIAGEEEIAEKLRMGLEEFTQLRDTGVTPSYRWIAEYLSRTSPDHMGMTDEQAYALCKLARGRVNQRMKNFEAGVK